MQKIELSCHFVKNYTFQIDTLTNPRIKDFDEIVRFAQKHDLKIVFNLLAENIQRAQELVGNELVWLMRQNRDILVNRYHKNNIIVVDNLEAVADSCFIDRNWPTEQYDETGRRIVATNLADSLRNFLPNAFPETKLNAVRKKL